ncbi:uncharacterized protein BJ212DRAFT_1335118 [Suillus subaureus]|uniref:Uncharacterized protein n=1 Tax=Suillus subaureus TaxID=48587 RepID=A0A9P7EII0_9AGAM|nr:uncharacterized protein BJ212DRAFT_1335118 [Suillus subaureus]KAG1821998.1 hypothetical protein BJ212DRAFT_1335118 [Suillus subaureus]
MRAESGIVQGEQYNSEKGLKRKEKLRATATNSSSTSERTLPPAKQMQKSTASPSAVVQSSDYDCVTSQRNNSIKQTTAQTHTLNCGRYRCPVVFVYAVGTDWPTVSRLLNDHSLSVPESLGTNHGNRDDEVIAGGSKRRKKEDQRKQELENDEYTEDVQPTSVRCRGCQKAISLDKRSRYYPGLWVKHRGKCPGILKLEVS